MTREALPESPDEVKAHSAADGQNITRTCALD
jgi:hypothetical protein